MEQQTISVARGGIVCNLPARAAILAAANPVGGQFKESKTLDQNVRVSAALLSRFDLIFVLRDRPDEASDRLLSHHLLSAHTSSRPVLITQMAGLADSERISPRLLKKYIMYARRYVLPKMSVEATAILKKYYLNLRDARDKRDTFPVTVRQLESLIRLSEAKARADLREDVTAQDAEFACKLMTKCSLSADGHAPDEPVDKALRSARAVTKGATGRSLKGASGARHLLQALQAYCRQSGSSEVTEAQADEVAQAIGISSSREFLDRLNQNGDLLQRPGNRYKVSP